MSRNRLAQNALVRRLCDEAGIPLLDTTPALEARLATGENVYFPDESHLNESGSPWSPTLWPPSCGPKPFREACAYPEIRDRV